MSRQPNSKKSEDDSDKEKTEVLLGDQETLNKEIQKAKEHDACFIMIRGAHQGQRYFMTQREMYIGRDPSADISIPDPSISRKHALVTKVGEQIEITDAGSANGTVINGKKLSAGTTVQLAKEDMVKLGNTILKFLPAGELEILMYGNLETAAHTDPLTKIYNKRYLVEALEAEFKRAKALNSDFSLLVFDIDFFKKINDTFGHDAGDMVLRELTAMIRTKHLRPKDVFARYGGEEFVILLLNTNAEKAMKLAEEIRSAVEAQAFIYENKRLPVTISLGVAELTSTMESPQTLFKSADKALYASKQGGRNRVTAAT